jgi:hypothetical protein
MTRSQAQSAQIERTRLALIVELGEDAVAEIDTEINRWIVTDTEPLALMGWLYSPTHKGLPVYDYGKMQIRKHFEEATQ